MGQGITAIQGITIGLDVGDRVSEAYAIDGEGEWIESFQVPTTVGGLVKGFSRRAGAQVVLEVGTHSPWISRQLKAQGLEVIVANPRRVRLIAQSDKKSDSFDAEQLARLGRIDPALLSPIVHRGESAQRDRVLLLARDGLVRTRTQLINQARGFAKSLGTRLPSSSSEAFRYRSFWRFSRCARSPVIAPTMLKSKISRYLSRPIVGTIFHWKRMWGA